jgi:hypothetical protein
MHLDHPEIEPGVVAKEKVVGPDGEHQVKVTKGGKVVLCSKCAEIREKYAEELATDPKLKDRLDEIEAIADPSLKAKSAAEFGEELDGIRTSRRSAIEIDGSLSSVTRIATVQSATAAHVGGESAPGKYTVGVYEEIKGTVPGMDAHHVGQKAILGRFVPDYDPVKAPAILVPKVGHTIRGPRGIVSRSTEGFSSARDVLARDILELRRVYPDIPNSQLQLLIQKNKDLYPIMNK